MLFRYFYIPNVIFYFIELFWLLHEGIRLYFVSASSTWNHLLTKKTSSTSNQSLLFLCVCYYIHHRSLVVVYFSSVQYIYIALFTFTSKAVLQRIVLLNSILFFLSFCKDGFKNISKLTLQSFHEICHNSRAFMGYVDLHKNSYHFHHDGWAVFPLLATKWNYSTSPDIFHCSFFVLLKLKDLVSYDLDIPL